MEQLNLLAAQNFTSDAPTAADLENWGFARPEREVTLTLNKLPAPNPSAAGPNNANTLTLQLGLASQRDNFAYARLLGAAFIYAVNPDILRLETPTTAAAWRERLLRELPSGARLTTLVAALRTLRAKHFPQDGFTEKVLLLGEDRPWRYRLDATLALPGAAVGAPAPVTSLLLSERFGGTQQLAGSQEFNAVFELEQSAVDALWSLTYRADPGPALAPATVKK